MPTKHFKSNASLGKTIKNKMNRARPQPTPEGYKIHTTITDPNENRPQLKSILEQNSLEEFMQMAAMSQRKFEAEHVHQSEVLTNTTIPDTNDPESLQNQAGMISKFLNEETILNPKY